MKTWHITLWGKHPAFSDYLNVGQAHLSVLPLVKWVQRGYSRYCLLDARSDRAHVLWHFWIVPDDSGLVCGLFMASKDVNERPYPLLIAGYGHSGPAGRSFDNTFLPSLIPVWQEMESLCLLPQLTLEELKNSLETIPEPIMTGAWPVDRPKEHMSRQRTCDYSVEALYSDNKQKGFFSLSLPHEQTDTFWEQISEVQAALDRVIDDFPVMMFVNKSQRCVECIFRPLQIDDYIRMYIMS